MVRPYWEDVQVRRCRELLTGPARLVGLFRWLRGETAGEEIKVITPERTTDDPLSIDWRNFPLQEAIEATYPQSAERH